MGKQFGITTVLLDFKKAFNTVDHEILLNKLEPLGIRTSSDTWPTDYLSNPPKL